jgi:hypothetical protein
MASDRERPCPVCDGAGKWDRETGTPVYGHPVVFGKPMMLCLYCKGNKVVPRNY